MSIFSKGASAALILGAMAMNAYASPCDRGIGSGVVSGITAGAPLTLEAALAELRNVSPEVRTAGLETLARSSEAQQAGRWLNPSILVDVENFAGGGGLSGFEQSESTFAIEQTFRLGGKRNLAVRAARAHQAVASAECAVILREAELETALLFSELAGAVRIHELALDAAKLSDDLTVTVARRVDAGAAAPPELSRAKADAAALKAAAVETGADIERRSYALAALWGSAEPQFAVPLALELGELGSNVASPPATHPRVTAAEATTRALRADQDAARAQAIPDVTVLAGLRRFQQSGDNAFVAGVSVPLPLFDRNRGNTRAAGLRADASAENRAAVEARLLADQRAMVASVKAAINRLDILETEALPAAEAAYAATVRGYASGKFDLTTTLDGRATLIDTRIAVIQAALSLQIHELRLRSLIGSAPFSGDQ